MTKPRKIIIESLILIILTSIQYPLYLYGGTTGKIAGRIVDAESSEPLSGANVIIEGTLLGAAADIDGDFFILNVSPGVYSVTASMIGYQSVSQTGIRVNLDKTTPLSFALSSQAFETGTIVVEGVKPVVEPDIASSITILTGEQIEQTPVFSFKDILDKQVGIREADMRGLFIRGEREYGVSLQIDGLETRDNIDNQIETRLNPDAVKEANVLTGGFNAEYGNAASGLINVVMKEGGDTYDGTLDAMYGIPTRKHFGPPLKYYWDQAFDNPEHWEQQANPQSWVDSLQFLGIYEQFLGKPELLRELYLWRMRDEVTKYGDKPDWNLRGTFGGPIPFINNTTFFISGRYEKVYYLFNQAQPFYDNLGFSGKITSQITPNLKISLTGRYSQWSGINRYDRKESEMSYGLDRMDDPDQTRENRYVFESVEGIAWGAWLEQAHLTPWPYADRMSISNRFKNQWGLKITHMLSAKSFFEISLIYSTFRVNGNPPADRDTTQTVVLRDSQGNEAVLTGEYALAPKGYWYTRWEDPLGMGAANYLGGTHGNYEDSKDKSFLIRAHFISQVTKTNQLNLGFEFNYVDLNKYEKREGNDGNRYWWDWHVYPKTVGVWIQDKLEFEGMIVNAGLRYDLRIPHHSWMNLKDYPFSHYWSDSYRQGYLGADSIYAGPHYKPPTKAVFSPRLSIAHPIGSDAKIFFNYTHQNQNPPYEYQYKLQRRAYQVGWDIFGNPELPYIKTVQYEIGYEQNLADVFFLAVSGYYRDVTNKLYLIEYEGEFHRDLMYRTHYRTYAPDFYSNARGIELRLEKRIGRFWTGWCNYNYEIFSSGIKGYETVYEDPTDEPEPRNEEIYTNETRKPTAMPKFNLGLNFHTPNKYGPALGNFYPIADIQINLLFWWKSQPTFTYESPEYQGLDPPYAPRDNKRWKAHHGTNLTLRKRFGFGLPITPVFYIQVYNLFNTKNMFRGAFTPDQRDAYVALLEGQGGDPGEKEDLAREAIGNLPNDEGPGMTPYDLFLNPRQIFLGLRFEF